MTDREAKRAAARRVRVHEVGPRDGLQAEAVFVETADKIALVDALSATGVAQIEVTAFVSPRAIPALRDAEAVLRGIRRAPGVVYAALVPNARGAERAIDARADELNLVMSATAGHNLANLRMTPAQSLAVLAEAAALARQARVAVNASLSCSFGCPIDGEVGDAAVLDACARFVDTLGADGVTLCDTAGTAQPTQVWRRVDAFRARFPGTRLTLHFHDTHAMASANVLAALDAGADRFDASIGGIGGCPYAPGATGNIGTEDAVHALGWAGCDTGVDAAALAAVSARLSGLLGRPLGAAAKAQARRQLQVAALA